mmetsp:Transcript_51946/g.62460  ORF Transcript_51946/g.62460 Transcript_51946/m.62460 type:complete len:738 (+) Transcript_51946:59-2272(+)|eukprot:CAMPEP_0172508088 /NCGR_PEP_ID=MMETSP1066-20121228/209076_1 /TAXON_ID=671091 /ORGANISM="Coscinodiscus wailesii, Strain CCMP2513" /LENGTH=737 /DNA_ID=CAMNT_0013285909 /DNA_START=59 /DNA_END=2272 /DNA_ORIENTATION=+
MSTLPPSSNPILPAGAYIPGASPYPTSLTTPPPPTGTTGVPSTTTNTTSSSKRNKPASSISSAAADTNAAAASALQNVIWQWDVDRVESWIRSLTTLYPPQKTNAPGAAAPDYWKTISRSNLYVQNLSKALVSASAQHDTAANRDLYKVLDSSFARGTDVVHKAGSMLSRMLLGGIINGISGKEGGVVEPTLRPDVSKLPAELVSWARTLKLALVAKLEMDMMESTMPRIVEILCPEVSMAEVNAIRKRVYDTVVLRRGTGSSEVANSLESEDLPVAARNSVHDIDKWKKCKVCGNNDQSNFCLDRKNGDLICTKCGTVSSSSLMHEGSQFRKFEGEADRNHHGDVANPLYSNAHNMSTTLGGVSSFSNQGMGGGSKRTLEVVLRNAHAFTEMNISQFGKDEKKTREGYKDRQKKDAFVKMTHVGDALNLHEAVVQRAKELFAGFRDDRELVQQFKGVVAACLCEAYHQLSSDGRQILKKVVGDEDADNPDNPAKLTARANWRNDMHKSSAANTPGFLPDTVNTGNQPNTTDKQDPTKVKAKNADSGIGDKYIPTWTLDDCRTWLLESSRSIARLWHTNPNNPNSAKPISELEGKLVEHTLALCTYLEKQLKPANNKQNKYHTKQRVITPRVNDMAHLSIKWQHVDMQRPQGAGGRFDKAPPSTKTAGQFLILLTSKKWTSIINDPLAGESFHKELKGLKARQEDKKKKRKSEEVTNNRFKQMKRKLWLQEKSNIKG